MDRRYADFSELEGKTLTKITGLEQYSDLVTFECTDGSLYHMYHEQDYCESVALEDFDGDIDTIINHKILSCYESSDNGDSDEYESCTWTFYVIRTMQGTMTLRWKGTSNGWYSESVDFVRVQ